MDTVNVKLVFLPTVIGFPKNSGGWSCVLSWRSWPSTRRATTCPTRDRWSTSSTADPKIPMLPSPCEGPRRAASHRGPVCVWDLIHVWDVSPDVVEELQWTVVSVWPSYCVHFLFWSFPWLMKFDLAVLLLLNKQERKKMHSSLAMHLRVLVALDV